MKKLLLTIVLGFTLINFSQAQNPTIETSVDSLGSDSYQLSFLFPQKPMYSNSLEDDFPFHLSYATRDASSYSIDSVKVSGDSLDVDVYLTLSEQKLYHFSFNDIVYQDSTSIYQPLFFRIDNTEDQRVNYGIYIAFFEALTKQANKILDEYDFINIHALVFDAKVLGEPYFSNYVTEYDTYQNYFVIPDSITQSLMDEESKLLDLKLLYSGEYENYSCCSVESSLDGTDADSVIFSTYITLINTDADKISSDSTHYLLWNYITGVDVYTPADTAELIQHIVEISTSTEQSPKIPQKTTLSAYPNPFNPSTQIQYTLPEAGKITISVFNVLGQQVRTLADGTRSSGNHTITFNATGLPAGMYVVRLESTGQSGKVFTETKKVMLLK